MSLKEAPNIDLKWKACRSQMQMQMQMQMQILNGKHPDVTTMWPVIISDWIDSPQSQNVNYKIQNTTKKIKEWKDKKKPIYDDLVISLHFWLNQQSSLRNTRIQTTTYKRGNKISWEYCRFHAYLNILGRILLEPHWTPCFPHVGEFDILDEFYILDVFDILGGLFGI